MRPPRPTSTFFLLVTLAAAASYGALLLTTQLSGTADSNDTTMTVHHTTAVAPVTPEAAAPAVVDTANWKEYVDLTYFLSFKYPPTWQIQTYPNQAGYYIIVLKPDTKADHIRIYINPYNYFALDGLPSSNDTLAGTKAVNINNAVVGVKYSAQYYTFDRGATPQLQPQFKEILSTVAFKR